MTASQPASTSPFIPWPEPSLTSKYNINLRYYRIVDEPSQVAVEWDIGAVYEELFEALYEAELALGESKTPKEFEAATRSLVENRFSFMVGMSTYPVLLSFLVGGGDLVFADMQRQTELLVTLHNRLAKQTGTTPTLKSLKPSIWKRLFG